MHRLADLIYEFEALHRVQRTGSIFLGRGRQSVAEHSFSVVAIAYLLVRLIKEEVDELQVLRLCLFHDLPESRSGDLALVHKRYVSVNQDKLLSEFAAESVYHAEIAKAIKEFDSCSTMEAKIAHDADLLQLLCFLKCEDEHKNTQSEDWMDKIAKSLITEVAKELFNQVKSHSTKKWWKRILEKKC